ncbi:hypothetical protein [Telmatospirillum siberiense]|uniref:Uncharacterized protein n=1 Tax=Telmatospirillum siberiense TaxID=382514 RepID=A0A2N3PNH1_9PROT|nr:hypothetical protein [Telmatospirillum siberiense]PKU21948.1 hypothetical protein CWS72_23890 [Telmatospirillum siberiense]
MRRFPLLRRSSLCVTVAFASLMAATAPAKAQWAVEDASVLSAVTSGFSALTSAVSAGFTAVVTALAAAASDSDAHFEQLLQASIQVQDAVLQAQTTTLNTQIYNDEQWRRQSLNDTFGDTSACQYIGPGTNLTQGETPIRQQAVAIATAHANLSRGGTGSAAANGQAASVSDKVQVHKQLAANPQTLSTTAPTSSSSSAATTLGTVTDVDADTLFTDTAIDSPYSLKIDSSSRTQTLGELFMAHSFDPVPPPPQRSTSEPNEFQEARNSRASRMSLAMAVPVDVLSNQAKVFDASMRQVLPLQPPGSDSMSWNQMMDAAVKGRFENLDWYAQVVGMSGEQKQNEALYMQALQLYLDWHRFRFEEKVGVVLANLYAGQIDNMRGSSTSDITPALAPASQATPTR